MCVLFSLSVFAFLCLLLVGVVFGVRGRVCVVWCASCRCLCAFVVWVGVVCGVPLSLSCAVFHVCV